MSRLLVLDPSPGDSEDVVDAARGLGCDIYTVTPGPPGPDAPVAAGHSLAADFSDPERVLRQVTDFAAARRVNGIVTVNEFLTPLAAAACAALGLPGNDPGLSDAARSKVAMDHRFRAGQIPVPRTLVFSRDVDIAAEVQAKGLPFPLVIKPAANAGSRGVSIVESPSGLPAALELACSQADVMSMRLDPRIVVQEHVSGEEFSVESVTQDGVIRHVCVTRKLTTPGSHRIEIGHSLPAQLDALAESRILAQASRAIAAAGIRNSVSHAELILTPGGDVVVLEIAARIGAGRIGALIEHATGFRMAEASARIGLGLPVPAPGPVIRYAAVRLLTAPAAGRLAAVTGLPEPGGDVILAGLIRPVGSIVSAPDSNRARVGYLAVTGASEALAMRRADALLRETRVVVDAAGDSS